MRTSISLVIEESRPVISCRGLFLLAAAVLLIQISAAQTSRTIAYQGVLSDSLGNPKPDGNYAFKFSLYNVGLGGSSIWTETKTLSVKRGLFTTALGDVTPFSASFSFKSQLWLGIVVSDQPELTPRVALLSVPSSLWSQSADSAGTVADNGITSAKIKDGSIQLQDIGQNSANTGQVMKWNGSSWSAGNDSTGGGGGTSPWQVNGSVVHYDAGNVGIGTATPNAPLSFPPWLGKKITLYPGPTGNAGLGVYGYEFRINSDQAAADITFGYDDTSSGFTERMRVRGNGNVGIGTLAPESRLHVAGGQWDLGSTEGDFKIGDAAYRLKIGVATGGGGAGDVRLRADGGTSRMILGSGTNDVLAITPAGVGINTVDDPTAPLEVNGQTKISSSGDFSTPQLLVEQVTSTDWSRIRFMTASRSLTPRFWDIAGYVGAGGPGQDRLNLSNSSGSGTFGVGGNGALYVNNNAGQPAQVLTSEGSGTPAHWETMSNIILTYYHNTSQSSGTLTPDDAFVFDEHTFPITVASNSRIILSGNFSTSADFCLGCGVSNDIFHVLIDGIRVFPTVNLFNVPSGESAPYTLSNFMYDIAPGTHTIAFEVQHGATGTNSSTALMRSSLMVIPR